MIRARNNLGAETRVTYAPSTRFYVADEQAGRPWVTRLPFPVQVVERVETIDWIGRNRLVTRYAYHHGYFDAYEREFRGFGLVESWDTEEFRDDTEFDDGDFVNWDQRSWSPPVLTRTWFHTGAFGQAGAVSQQYVSEYWTEPALRAPGQAAAAAAMRLPDTVLPDGLGPYEAQEAYRALKGHALRIETYAEDGSAAAANPYTVTEQNFTVRLVQPQGPNLHAVFFVHPREALTFHYERGAADPRVGHELTLETDDYGNVLRSVSVGYPRRPGYPPPEPTLSAAAQAMLTYDQTRLHIRGAEHGYTNPVDDVAAWPDAYRAPLVCTVDSAEITGVAPPVRAAGITNLFTFGDIDGPGGVWSTAWTPAADIAYEQVPASDIDGTGVPAAAPTRRFVARQRVRYRADDLTAVLGPGELQPRALPGESYQAALTPGMVSAIFGSLVPAVTLTAAGFVQLAGETGWWIPSGRVYYSSGDGDTPAVELAQAMISFFLPFRAVDPLGAITRAGYDGHWLLPATATDAVGNVTSAVNDYRVLLPATVTDPNGNRVSLAFDVFGRVTATAMMGTAAEAVGDELTGFSPDLDEAALAAVFADPTGDPAAVLGNATIRILYDTGAYQRTSGTAQPSPVAVCTLARETHVSDLTGPTSYQYRFVYGDGFGREIQRTARAAPDPVSGAARWATSGWTIYDNKGRPVRAYEPFFSATNAFEFGAASGVSHGHAIRPAGPCRRDAASRQHLGEGHVRAVARAEVGRRRHGPCRGPAVRPRRRRLLHPAARDRGVHLLVRPSHRRPVRLDARAAGRASGRGAQDGPVRGNPGDDAPRLGRPGMPGRGGQRSGSPLPGPDRLRHRGQATGGFRRAGQARGGALLPIAGPQRRVHLHHGHRHGWPIRLPRQRRQRRAAHSPRRGRAGHPDVGCPRPRVPARLRSGAAAHAPVREHGRHARGPAHPERLRRRPAGGEPVRPAVPRLRRRRVPGEHPVRLQGQPEDRRPAARRGLPLDGRLDAAGQPHNRRRPRRRRGRRGPSADRGRRPGPVREQYGVRRPQPAGPAGRAAQPGDDAGCRSSPGTTKPVCSARSTSGCSRRRRRRSCSTRPPPTGTR